MGGPALPDRDSYIPYNYSYQASSQEFGVRHFVRRCRVVVVSGSECRVGVTCAVSEFGA